MTKTKMIQDGVCTCEKKLDTKINDFIEENKKNIKVVDIKFASVNGRATALIIYKEYEQ